ncbi:hypothetical protein GCM10009530_44700 [Microbispora corallina]|uniref:Uncharacterized protein n=1 Tax=Microbispora corallina TaxID=83302 RepID=A0ABQ4FWS1_9ACTN|nr:DUF6461 domain-containing protein [Microbispora corallina]GIH39271.1 hypothetical protein Mco01_22710 [Microbispora corallina]
MSGATADDYAWFDEHDEGLAVAFCVTFVGGLTPQQAFERLGIAAVADVDDLYFDGAIGAAEVHGGTILVEPNGFACTLDDVAKRLSAGAVTASVFLNVNADQQFVHAVDGRIVTRFEPDYPMDRAGGDEDRLLPHMVELGMPTEDDGDEDDDWGDPIHTAFALAERVTGVRMTPDALDEPVLVGSTRGLL